MEHLCNGTRDKESLYLVSEASASSMSSSSALRKKPWRPRPLAFHLYSRVTKTNPKHHLRVAVRRPLVARLTKDIVELYRTCNSQFHYSEEFNPKTFLTSPSIGLLNDGYDNEKSDLILSVDYLLINPETNQRYIVKGILGHGTFGQVAKCRVPESEASVAVKIIKNLPAYYQQALVEVTILTTLNKNFDHEDKHHIVRIYDYFVFKGHLCIVFELLNINLYEFIKMNKFRGLSLGFVQLFSKQILSGLSLIKEAGVIHCDLKPENILLCSRASPMDIKIIDFGSACMEHRTIYSYIQSRYYRSPEVILGHQYNTAIDMWSFGCIVAELYLGFPLFPGSSEFDILRRMIKILGAQPPDYILQNSKNTCKFFKIVGSSNCEERNLNHGSNSSIYRTLTEEEFAARESEKPSIGKEYYNNKNLREIVLDYPCKKNLSEEEIAEERQLRLALIDFLRGLVELDPAKRWSPLQASKHPFVTGEHFTHPYEPAVESPSMRVSQNFNPAGGHSFDFGLPLNVPGMNHALMPSSPRYQMMHYVRPGSLGSHRSYGSFVLGSSYGSFGSYGDGNNFNGFYSPAGPSSMNSFAAQRGIPVLGNSPDARHMMQFSHGNGLGFSPGNLVPISLGSSPSQLTPLSSYSHISVGSPGKYGPPSPVRGNCQGSPLGKTASGNNRRKNWNYHANFQSQDPASSSQGQYGDIKMHCQPEGAVLVGSPSRGQRNTIPSSRRPQQGGRSGITHAFSSNTQSFHGSAPEKSEASNLLPDPGDWDPNYSDELLLQEDNAEVSQMTGDFVKGMHLSQSLEANGSMGIARRPVRLTNAYASKQRLDGPFQSYFYEASGSSEIHGYSHSPSKSYFSQLNHSAPSHPVMQPNHLQSPGRTAPFRDGRRGGHQFSNAFHGRKGYSSNRNA